MMLELIEVKLMDASEEMNRKVAEKSDRTIIIKERGYRKMWWP